MDIIDTHAHLDFDRFEADFDEILDRAREAGVGTIVTIGASRGYESNLRAVEIARARPRVFCTLGIHPHDAAVVSEDHLEALRRIAVTEPKVVGIGETGLDFHYDRSPRDDQRRAFRAFIGLAREVDKPLVVHSREAEEETIAILEEEGANNGVLHCFSGSDWLAERALALGFYVSFSGIVTFKKADEVQRVAMAVPPDRLLVETDAPYLAPTPHRGKRNEPAFVRHTLEFIAQLRGQDASELARQTTDNARRLFRLP